MKKNFTLSEVLITLVVIGIIAAITIPALMNNIENHNLISSYKKVYSTLSQVHERMKADNGNSLAPINVSSSEELAYLLKNYFVEAKICKAGNGKECFPVYKHLNGSKVAESTINSHPSIVLTDGTLLLLNLNSSSCTSSLELKQNIGCFRVRADLNGLKNPNTVGKDIHDFYFIEDKVIARGAH